MSDSKAFSLGIRTPFSPLEPLSKEIVNTLTTTGAEIASTSHAAIFDFDIAIDSQSLGRRTTELCQDGYFESFDLNALRGKIPKASAGNKRMQAVISEGFWSSAFNRDETVVGRRLKVNDVEIEIAAIVSAPFVGISLETQLWLVGDDYTDVLLGGSTSVDGAEIAIDYAGVMLVSSDVSSAELEARISALQRLLVENADLGEEEQLIALASVGRNPAQVRQWHREMLLALTFALIIAAFAIVIVTVNRGFVELERLDATRTQVAIGAPPYSVAVARVVFQLGALAFAFFLAWFTFSLISAAPENHLGALAPSLALTLSAIATTSPVIFIFLRHVSSRPLKTSSRTSNASFTAMLLAVNSAGLVILALTAALGMSYRGSDARDIGFDVDGLTVYSIDAAPGTNMFVYLNLPQTQAMISALDEAIRAAGVSAFAWSVSAPMRPPMFFDEAGVELEIDRRRVNTRVVPVGSSDQFFDVLGVSFLAGRARTTNDDEMNVVVNQSLSRLVAGTPDMSINRTFKAKISGLEGWREFRIIGVVPDLNYAAGRLRNAPHFFRSLKQTEDAKLHLVVADEIDPQALMGRVRAIPNRFYPGLFVVNAAHYADLQSSASETGRTRLAVASFIALMQGLISAMATFSLWTLMMRMRQREYCLRLALGANPATLRRDFIVHSVKIMAASAIVGAPLLWLIVTKVDIDIVATTAAWIGCFAFAWLAQVIVMSLCAASALKRTLTTNLVEVLRSVD